MVGKMAHRMACEWACKMAHRMVGKMACQWACKMVWVGHKMVWMACILKNNPVLAHNRMWLVVADILHSGNLVLDRMVDSIQGTAAGSYIPGVGNSYIPGVGNSYILGVGNSYIAGVGNSYIAGVGNSYIAG